MAEPNSLCCKYASLKLLFVLFVLSVCGKTSWAQSETGLAGKKAPPKTFVDPLLDKPQMKVDLDIPYVQPEDKLQMLDMYYREGKGRPILFWIHGGGWQRGDKSDVDLKAKAFVEHGYVFVSTNYRLYPDVRIQDMAVDVARAIRWVHDHAAKYGGDATKMFIMGHSAGAQLAALVCTDNRYLEKEGLALSMIKGCVPVDGDTYDVPLQIATVELRRAEVYKQKFGGADSQVELSAVSHVAKNKGIPPFLILHVADHAETKAQSLRLAERLQEAAVSAIVVPVEGKNHLTINSELGDSHNKATESVLRFFAEKLKP